MKSGFRPAHQAKIQKTQQPYIYEYYNIFGYYTMPSSGSHHTIGRVVNSLITALNTRDRLPRLVVIMLDKDLIEDVGIYDHCAEDVIAQNLDWLIRQIEVAIKRRQMELTDIKPGAVYGSDPKIVLVEMIRRPLAGFMNPCPYF